MDLLMQGKRGLIMGVANNHSIAWGITQMLCRHGAEVALTYQGELFKKRVVPLAESVNARAVIACDVTEEGSVKAMFDELKSHWQSLDFVVHAIAFSDKAELQGRYADTSRENFAQTMMISCFSFTEVVREAANMMPNGGSALTLSYGGSLRVMPNYNVMGVAKAALESSVRYLAMDYGLQQIRVNALSPGSVRTLAGAGIADARQMYAFQKKHAPLARAVSLEDIGGSALYLLSNLSGGVTGEVHHADCGYNIISMPRLEELRKP